MIPTKSPSDHIGRADNLRWGGRGGVGWGAGEHAGEEGDGQGKTGKESSHGSFLSS